MEKLFQNKINLEGLVYPIHLKKLLSRHHYFTMLKCKQIQFGCTTVAGGM